MKNLALTFLILLFAGIPILEAQQQWDEIDYPPLNNFEKPDVEIFELENGVTFYLLVDDELPLINIHGIIRTGSFLIPNEKAGLASITGTVMRTGGTTSIPPDELDELLENRAASISTGIGLTSGSASLSVLKEDIEELLPVFVDVLQNPAFPEERISLAKTQIRSSISRRNDEQAGIAQREFRRLIYGPESVYGRNTEYETIDNITRQDLVDFHTRSFVGENMMIGVIGDFEPGLMKQLLEEAFGGIPAGEEIELDLPEVNYEFEPSIHFVDKRDVNQSYVLLGHIGGMRDNPDYASLQVMNRVLSDGFSGRLMRIVRSQMGLAYSVFGNYGNLNFYPGTFTAGVMTQSASTADAIDAIIVQIERLQAELVSEEELQQTIDRFLNSLVFQYDSRASVLNESMSYEYAGLPADTFDRLVEEIQAVTAEDVQEAARRYLRPGALRILVVGNGAEIGDQLERYGEVQEVDITIPEPGADEEEQASGDTVAGREWMRRMSEALLPAGDAGTLLIESENRVQTPQGEMQLESSEEVNFAEKRFINQISMMMGEIIFEIEEGTGVMKMGGQEQQMPPEQFRELMQQYNRHYVNLALHHEEIDVEFIGETEKNGMALVELRVHLENPVTLYLARETALPYLLAANQRDPQSGERVLVESHYEEWEESGGVLYAYRTSTYVDGEEQASTVVLSHSVKE